MFEYKTKIYFRLHSFSQNQTRYGFKSPVFSHQPQKPYGNRKELELDFAEIPWQAMILLKTDKSLLCGGVIVRPNVVMTTGSCVEG